MSQYNVIHALLNRGWISLRQMGVLLGYKDPRGIYPRQKTERAIETMRIGGVDRVYPEAVIYALQNCPPRKAEEYTVLLELYMAGIKSKKRREKLDA